MKRTPPPDRSPAPGGRWLRWRTATMMLGMLTVFAAFAEESLTVVTWGGAYEESQRAAYFEPFTAATGIAVEVRRYNGGIAEIREQVESGQVTWDVVDLVLADNLEACDERLLDPIDHSRLEPAPDGTPPAEDFLEGSLTRCAAPQVIYATVLAFDARAFPGQRPEDVSALFDLERFPGKRALQRRPIANLEWALRSYGVPRAELYSMLSTERGLNLAFARLDSIREHIIWWEDGETPAELLASGEAVLASGYNGRFFDAMINDHQPIQTLWESQIYDYSVWGIPRGAPNAEIAKRFIRFATSTESLAAQARYIAYGPARKSSAARVWRHEVSGIDIRPHLPTYAPNFERAIRRDHEWYARTQEQLNERFRRWLAR